MPRTPKGTPPKYRKHKKSGQAIVTVRLPDGTRRDILLGPYGSPESKAEYRRVLADLEAGTVAAPARARTGGVTVAELLLAFLDHAETYYRRPDGTATSEVREFKLAMRPVRELYAAKPAAAFGPLDLEAVRQRMIAQGLCRGLINQRVGRLKRVWAWGAGREMVPAQAAAALKMLRGLEAGRSAAKEGKPVKPVAWEAVEATLPLLNPVVRAMVEVQWLTGMRSDEVCQLRAEEIDRSAAVWLYRPEQHKGRHRGKVRVVAIGPKAQAVLLPFLDASGPEEYLFSPAKAMALRGRHRGRNGKPYANRYGNQNYYTAVRRAAERADAKARADRPDAPEGRRLVPHWHPHQLRHALATEVRRRKGLEAAGSVLGHTRLSITELYAERDVALAVEIAAEIG